MPTTSVIPLKGMAANNIDSDQYVDGSIDAAHLSANSVDSAAYVDGSIDTVHIGDDQVTGAKLNPALVTGDIIYADGTGTINRLAKPGTPAGEVLTFATSASAPSWVAAAGGGWAFVSSQTASNDSSIDFASGITSGYDYKVVGKSAFVAQDGAALDILLGVSGPTYRTSLYLSWMGYIRGAGSSGDVYGNANTALIRLAVSAGNAADEFQHFDVTFYDPANASTDTNWLGQTAGINVIVAKDNYIHGGHYTTSEAHVALRIIPSGGNITSGQFYLYKRANA